MKHTRGNWKVSSMAEEIFVSSEIHGGICVIPHNGKHVEEHEANAKLIAAAPDLLESLKDLIQSIEYLADKGIANANSASMCRARIAIEKAIA